MQQTDDEFCIGLLFNFEYSVLLTLPLLPLRHVNNCDEWAYLSELITDKENINKQNTCSQTKPQSNPV